jgi:hypothetical protein
MCGFRLVFAVRKWGSGGVSGGGSVVLVVVLWGWRGVFAGLAWWFCGVGAGWMWGLRGLGAARKWLGSVVLHSVCGGFAGWKYGLEGLEVWLRRLAGGENEAGGKICGALTGRPGDDR